MVLSILNMRAVMLILFVCLATYCRGNSASKGKSSNHVLVTGGAGFIGSHLVGHLSKKGYTVQVVDNFNAHNSVYMKRLRAEYAASHPGVTMTEGDVCDAELLRKLLTGSSFSHIIHLASQPPARHNYLNKMQEHVGSISNSSRSECFATLMEQLVMVHKSSAKPYPRVLYPATYLPHSNGIAKRTEELGIAASYHQQFGIPVAGLRFPLVYGPMQRSDAEIMYFTDAIVSGKPINILNYAEEFREYVYIDDIVNELATLVSRSGHDKSVIHNFRPRAPTPLKNLISLLETNFGKRAIINDMKKPFIRPNTYLTAVDDLSKRNVGSEAETSLAEGLKKFSDWYKTHESSLMSCSSECSHDNLCFHDEWLKPAEKSRRLSVNCSVVLYTVSNIEGTSDLHEAPSDNFGCNFAFIVKSSVLYKKTYAQLKARNLDEDSHSYHWWTIIGIDEFGPPYKDTRKPTRVPKINPGRFFASPVSHAIYADTSIMFKNSMKFTLLHFISSDGDGKKAVFAAVRHPFTDSVAKEIDDVLAALGKRANKTMYPQLIAKQKAAYLSYEKENEGVYLNQLFDAAFIAHDLKTPGGEAFRCRWYREYQEWADRDQPAGGFTLATMMYENRNNVGIGDPRPDWSVIGVDPSGKLIYAHLLPKTDHGGMRFKKGNFYKKAKLPLASSRR